MLTVQLQSLLDMKCNDTCIQLIGEINDTSFGGWCILYETHYWECSVNVDTALGKQFIWSISICMSDNKIGTLISALSYIVYIYI